jgi:hypothetical protein
MEDAACTAFASCWRAASRRDLISIRWLRLVAQFFRVLCNGALVQGSHEMDVDEMQPEIRLRFYPDLERSPIKAGDEIEVQLDRRVVNVKGGSTSFFDFYPPESTKFIVAAVEPLSIAVRFMYGFAGSAQGKDRVTLTRTTPDHWMELYAQLIEQAPDVSPPRTTIHCVSAEGVHVAIDSASDVQQLQRSDSLTVYITPRPGDSSASVSREAHMADVQPPSGAGGNAPSSGVGVAAAAAAGGVGVGSGAKRQRT